MRVEALGPVRVLADDHEVDLGGPRSRALVARLALAGGRPVPAATLIDDLWGDDVPAAATNALQSVVSRTRRRLPHGALVSTPSGYVLGADSVDVLEAERHVARGEHAAALALWRGEPLGGLDGVPFVESVVGRLDELRLGALEAVLAARVRAGADPGVVAELADLTAAHPYREGLWSAYLRALVDTGNQAEALAAFERLRTRLSDDLGTDPSPALQEIHLAILRGEAHPSSPSASPRSARLPVGLTTFVGRDVAVAELVEALDLHRLVTVLGPGGAGKTRLAIEAARTSAFDDVWLVELAAVTGGDDVVPVILAALGQIELSVIDRRSSGPPPGERERLRDALAEVRGLLLLDNCEHLVDDVARVVDDVLAHAPRLVVLATSREPLRLTGELSFPVEPLTTPPHDVSAAEALRHSAVDLFVQRARAVDRGFALDADTVADVVEICTRLDGQPLALELAAARLRTMTVSQVAARLSDRFRLLTGGSRTALPRHRTLRAVVEWSWDLLDAEERDLAERLSVFPGGVGLDAAAAVAPDGLDVVEVLESLADKSLLVPVRGDEPRFRMLETLREFGTERLVERGDVDDVRGAHLEHFLGLVERLAPHLRGPDQLAAFDALDVERGNITAALRHAIDRQDRARAGRLVTELAWYWSARGQDAEARAWITPVAALPGHADPGVEIAIDALGVVWALAENEPGRVDEHVGRILVSFDTGLADGWFVELVMAAIALFDKADGRVPPPPSSPWTRAAVALMKVLMLDNAGQVSDTTLLLDEAIAGFRAVGDRWGIATAVAQRGAFESYEGQVTAALASWQEARELLLALGAEEDLGLADMRIVALRLSIADEADLPALRADLEERDREAEASGSARAVVVTRLHRGALERVAGHAERAVELMEEVKRRSDDQGNDLMGSLQMQATLHAGLAAAQMEAGRTADAADALRTAGVVAKRSMDMPVVSVVAVVSAMLARAEGDPALAARRLGAAERIRGRVDRSNRDARQLAERLRAEMGQEAFAAEHEAGRRLERADALTLALLDGEPVDQVRRR